MGIMKTKNRNSLMFDIVIRTATGLVYCLYFKHEAMQDRNAVQFSQNQRSRLPRAQLLVVGLSIKLPVLVGVMLNPHLRIIIDKCTNFKV